MFERSGSAFWPGLPFGCEWSSAVILIPLEIHGSQLHWIPTHSIKATCLLKRRQTVHIRGPSVFADPPHIRNFHQPKDVTVTFQIFNIFAQFWCRWKAGVLGRLFEYKNSKNIFVIISHFPVFGTKYFFCVKN